jgi:hypothetical protein
VFDHIDRWRVLEQPAGENLPPGELAFRVGALFHVNLDEGAGFRRLFPRQGAFTSCRTDHHIADPLRFTRFEQHVLRDIVPLVQQAERYYPVLHRRAIFAFDCGNAGLAGHGIGNIGGSRVGIAALPTGSQQQERPKGDGPPHCQASGLQAS